MKNIIHIFGASGSGTTTLGKRIANELGFIQMDTDDYFWEITDIPYTVIRSKEERINMMKADIEKYDNIVISGSLSGWGDVLIPKFTLAIRVTTDTKVRLERLKKREREKFGNRIDKGGDMYKGHQEFLEWAGNYDTGDITMRSKVEHDQWQRLLQCELLQINGEDVYSFDMDIIRKRLR